MKKILFAVFALAALASCTNNEVIELNQQAIAFGDVFVDNATRVDYSQTGEYVDAFKVYGNVTAANGTPVQIFNGADVTRPTTGLDSGYDATKAWNCTETQYWVSDAEYQFAAIVDGQAATCEDGLPATINFTVTDGDGDLLYAEAVAETDENATPKNNAMVAFTFNHLLSKVQFKITNSIGTGYSIKVTGISVDGALDKGVYTVDGGIWAKADGATKLATPLAFGTTGELAYNASAVASHTCQILPLAQELSIKITYEIYFGGKLLSTNTTTGPVSQTFAKDTAYSINAAITGSRIQFTVSSVAGFTNSGDITLE